MHWAMHKEKQAGQWGWTCLGGVGEAAAEGHVPFQAPAVPDLAGFITAGTHHERISLPRTDIHDTLTMTRSYLCSYDRCALMAALIIAGGRTTCSPLLASAQMLSPPNVITPFRPKLDYIYVRQQTSSGTQMKGTLPGGLPRNSRPFCAQPGAQ